MIYKASPIPYTQAATRITVLPDNYKPLKDKDSILFKVISYWNTHLKADSIPTTYSSWTIPKKTGGARLIEAPNEALMKWQKSFIYFMETYVVNLYRDNKDYISFHSPQSFGFVAGRSTKSLLMVHQANKSEHYAKMDIHNFFGSITMDMFLTSLSQIYPFNEWMQYDYLKRNLIKACDLLFYHGSLPQGAPSSPWISNLVMMIFDYQISNALGSRFVYTRYADDIIISSRGYISPDILKTVRETLLQCSLPLQLNEKKTRFGSIHGANWNLGLIVNDNNEISIGWRNTNRLKVMLFQYYKDAENGNSWSDEEINQFKGLLDYWLYIEPEKVRKYEEKYRNRFN